MLFSKPLPHLVSCGHIEYTYCTRVYTGCLSCQLRLLQFSLTFWAAFWVGVAAAGTLSLLEAPTGSSHSPQRRSLKPHHRRCVLITAPLVRMVGEKMRLP